MGSANENVVRSGCFGRLLVFIAAILTILCQVPSMQASGEAPETAIEILNLDSFSNYQYSGSEMWFFVQVENRHGITMATTAHITAGKFVASLYDPRLNSVSSANYIYDGVTETLSYTPTVGGKVYIKVAGYNGAEGSFDLAVFNAWYNPGTSDGDRSYFSTMNTARQIADGTFALSWYGSEYYRFCVPDDADFAVTVVPRIGIGNLECRLYNQYGAHLSTKDYIDDGETATLSGHASVGGVYYCRVIAEGGAYGDYDLSVASGLGMNDDGDGDGLYDDAEYHHGTRPDDADTDGDGASDYAELAGGEDPICDYPFVDSSSGSSSSTAVPITQFDGFFTTEYPDRETWYSLELADGQGVTVALTARTNGGKLYFKLYDPRGNLLGTADYIDDGETGTISHRPTVGGVYKILVDDGGGYGRYDLGVFNAWYNPGTSDGDRSYFSTMNTARQIADGTFALSWYGSEYYRFCVPDDADFAVTVVPRIGIGNLECRLYNQYGAHLSTKDYIDDGETATLSGHASVGGVYYCRVIAEGGAYGDYDLSVSSGLGMNDDGDGDGLYDDAEYHHGTRPDDADTDGDGASDYAELAGGEDPICDYPFVDSSSGSSSSTAVPITQFDGFFTTEYPDRETWYSLELADGQGVTVALTARTNGGKLYFKLYDPRGNLLGTADYIDDGETGTISHRPTVGGVYKILVDDGGGYGRYDLGVFNAWYNPGTSDGDRSYFSTMNTARQIADGTFALSWYGSEYYRFCVPDDADFAVTVVPRIGIGNLECRLYNQYGAHLSTKDYIDDGETATLSGHASVGGVYYCRVIAEGGAYGDYDLSVSSGLGMNDDGDGDGLYDDAEYHHGTRPDDADTDGDGASDYAELAGGEDPICDYPFVDSSSGSSSSTAVPITQFDGFFTTEYPDRETWYSLELADGQGVTVALTARTNGGKLYFKLYDPRGNLLGTADYIDDGETGTISHRPTVGGVYKILVDDGGGYGRYDLGVFNAWYNPGTSDGDRSYFSTMNTARHIADGSFALSGYGNEYYRFCVPDDADFAVTVVPRIGIGNLECRLYNQYGAHLSTKDYIDDGETAALSGHASVGGVYYCRVIAEGGAYGDYDLSVSSGLGMNVDSDGDGLFDPAEFHHGTRLDDADTDGDGASDYAELAGGEDPICDYPFVDSSSGSSSAEAVPITEFDRFFTTEYPDRETWYSLELAEGQGVSVALRARTNGGKLYFKVYNPSGSLIGTVDYIDDGETATFSHTPSVGGVYKIKVDDGGGYGRYDLAVFNAWFNGGDFDQRTFYHTFNTAKVLENASCDFSVSGDSFFRLEAQSGDTITFRILPHIGLGKAVAKLYDQGLDLLKTVDYIYDGQEKILTFTATDSGVHYLKVYAASGAYGYFDLRMEPSDPVAVDPAVTVRPVQGINGTIFEFSGHGFSPGSTAFVQLVLPDGSQPSAVSRDVNFNGDYRYAWRCVDCDEGLYRHWAEDDYSGELSQEVAFEVADALILGPEVVWPNGGETLLKGNSYAVSWTSLSPALSVEIYLMAGDYRALTIAQGAPNTGSFDFHVPESIRDSDACTIRIAYEDGSAEDESDAPFAIETNDEIWRPVYRFFLDNSPYREHLYTTFEPEVDSPWSPEGIEFYVASENFEGAAPVYRLRNDSEPKRLRLLTASKAEKDAAVASGYVFEQVLGYVFPPDSAQGSPIYRIFNQQTGDRLYTSSQAEAQGAVENQGFAWENDLGRFVETSQPEIVVCKQGYHIGNGTEYRLPETVDAGGSAEVEFEIANLGGETLNIGLVRVDAQDFSLARQPASTVGPNATTNFIVRFSPSSFGTRTGAISISTNDSNENPFSFTIRGTAQSPAPPDFCFEEAGTTVAASAFGYSKSIVLKNCGDQTLQWAADASGSTWLHATPSSGSLDGGQTVSVLLEVDPNDGTSSRSGELLFYDTENSSNFRKVFFDQNGKPPAATGDNDVVAVWTSVDEPTVGAPCDLFAKIRNVGDAASEATTVTWYRWVPGSKTELCSAPLTSLEPGGEATVSCTHTFDDFGTIHILAKATPFDGETETSNNQRSSGVRILMEPAPQYSFKAAEYNFGNIGTRSDVFHIWLKLKENEVPIASELLAGYDFEIRTGGPQGVLEARLLSSSRVSDDKHRLEFEILKETAHPRAANFVDGNLLVYKKLGDGSETGPYSIQDMPSFTVFGTTFDLEKHSWAFANGDWEIPDQPDTIGHFYDFLDVQYFKAGDIVSGYMDSGSREGFWKFFGVKSDAYKFLKPIGGCYGLVGTALSNFNHSEESLYWGGGALEDWDDEILERWDTGSNSAKPPHKSFENDNIYNDAVLYRDGGPSLQAMKKVMYYWSAQSRLTGINWVAEDGDLVEANQSDIRDILGHGSPVFFGIESAGHLVAGTQLFSWNKNDKLMIWDNNFTLGDIDELHDGACGPQLEWHQGDNGNYQGLGRIDFENKIDGNGGAQKYQLSNTNKLLLPTEDMDSQNIYNRWPDNKSVRKERESETRTDSPDEPNAYVVYDKHINILLIGAKVDSVKECNSGDEIPLVLEGQFLEDQAVLYESANGFYLDLYLPVSSKYRIDATKFAGWPSVKIFVTIPYEDKSVERINYENLGLSESDDSSFYFYVGRDNNDKQVYSLEEPPEVLGVPDFDETFQNAVFSPSDFTAAFENGAVDLNWNNPSWSPLASVKIVRSETDFPDSPDDGTLVFDALAESFSDAGVVAGKQYYYCAFGADSQGNLSHPVSARIDTSLACVAGMIETADSSPVEDAEFKLIGQDGLVENLSTSDIHGNYVLSNVPNGNYILEASHFSHEIENPVRSVCVYGQNIREDFTATPIPVLSLLSEPEDVHVGDRLTVRWVCRNIDHDKYIDLMCNTGLGWETIQADIPVIAGKTSWTVSGPEIENATLKIVLKENDTVFDETDFSIRKTMPGDLTGDDLVNLEDAVVGMQIAVGVPGIYADARGDIDGDGRIGLVESVNALVRSVRSAD